MLFLYLIEPAKTLVYHYQRYALIFAHFITIVILCLHVSVVKRLFIENKYRVQTRSDEGRQHYPT